MSSNRQRKFSRHDIMDETTSATAFAYGGASSPSQATVLMSLSISYLRPSCITLSKMPRAGGDWSKIRDNLELTTVELGVLREIFTDILRYNPDLLDFNRRSIHGRQALCDTFNSYSVKIPVEIVEQVSISSHNHKCDYIGWLLYQVLLGCIREFELAESKTKAGSQSRRNARISTLLNLPSDLKTRYSPHKSSQDLEREDNSDAESLISALNIEDDVYAEVAVSSSDADDEGNTKKAYISFDSSDLEREVRNFTNDIEPVLRHRATARNRANILLRRQELANDEDSPDDEDEDEDERPEDLPSVPPSHFFRCRNLAWVVFVYVLISFLVWLAMLQYLNAKRYQEKLQQSEIMHMTRNAINSLWNRDTKASNMATSTLPRNQGKLERA